MNHALAPESSILTPSRLYAGVVEIWLQKLVEGMQDTVKAIVKRVARNVYEMDLKSFIFSHPAQTALLGIQFQWTADTQARAFETSRVYV